MYIALGHWKAGLALYVTLDQRGDGEIGEVTDEEKGGVGRKKQALNIRHCSVRRQLRRRKGSRHRRESGCGREKIKQLQREENATQGRSVKCVWKNMRHRLVKLVKQEPKTKDRGDSGTLRLT